LAIFISYNLQFYVAAEIIWSYVYRSSKYLQSLTQNTPRVDEYSQLEETVNDTEINKSARKTINMIELIFRSSLVIFTFLLAVSIPRIDLFISLVGAVASSTLAIILPPILDLIVFWPQTNYSTLRLIKNILIILFGVYIFGAGTFVSFKDIINYLTNG
jgi:amino acid permease